jgi:hypothetical protein
MPRGASGRVVGMPPEVPSPHDPHVRHLRRMFLAVVTGSFLFLIPWLGYLSVSLPNHHEVDQWRFAWVGFDGALITAIGITALCAWRRLQIFIPWAIVTATLLCCDAWFDIVLDWNSDELSGAILAAAFAELPLAALLVYAARKMIRLTVLIAWHRAGRTGPVPPLSRLTLIRLAAEDEAGHDRDLAPDRDAPSPDRGHSHDRDAPSYDRERHRAGAGGHDRPDPYGHPDRRRPDKHERDHHHGEQARGSHRGPDPSHDLDPGSGREPGPGHDRDGERR